MSNTPETDAAIIASNGQWSFVLKETCQRLERERDEARARVEIIKPNENSPVAEFFSSSNTPETDAKASDIIGFFSCATVPAEFARRLERERDEAQKHLQDIKEYGTEEINAAVELRQKLAAALHERDEARSLVDHYREQKDLLPISWDV